MMNGEALQRQWWRGEAGEIGKAWGEAWAKALCSGCRLLTPVLPLPWLQGAVDADGWTELPWARRSRFAQCEAASSGEAWIQGLVNRWVQRFGPLASVEHNSERPSQLQRIQPQGSAKAFQIRPLPVLLPSPQDMCVSTKTMHNMQVNFYLGKMRTSAQEIAYQIALRDSSKEAVGEDQHMRFWWRGSSVQSSAYFIGGFLLVMRSWYHREGIGCFSRYEEMQGLGSWNQFLRISV